jgi:16S rRNA (guanine966-N2)-methyltransferase
MTLRLIAGEKGGLHLNTPKGTATRPTLGRIRASLFMILRDRLAGARILDLFAGSGALGLEAVSRGAAKAVLVENARPALDALRSNIAKTGWEDKTEVISRDAFSYLKNSAREMKPFDLIMLDPPYHADLAERTLTLLALNLEAWLAPDGMIVAQAGRRDPLAMEYPPLALIREERYSETRIAFYARAALA